MTAGIEPSLGPLATAYVLILVIVGPLTARFTEPVALRITGRRRAPANRGDAGVGGPRPHESLDTPEDTAAHP